MLSFAILTILFAYSFFFLGIFHMLFPSFIIVDCVFYVIAVIFLFKISFVWKSSFFQEIKKKKIILLIFTLFFGLFIITFLGVLSPETSFDAVWYHLTFPKLYLQHHSIFFIPGGVLYYSAMPKLGELLFIPALFWGGETAAKAVQFLFSLLTVIILYKTARKYVSIIFSLLVCLIFYSNIVVSWEASVAYIDIIRAFFEVIAFYVFLLWIEKKSIHSLVLLGCMIGAAMATKILAFSSLIIFSILIMVVNQRNKQSLQASILHIFIVTICSFIVVLPWLAFSYLHTGNPVYPFFTPLYKTTVADNAFAFYTFFQDVFKIFLFSDDPISPIYLIIIPLVIALFNRFSPKTKLVAYYCFAAFIFWYLTPRTGGGRFILPYLPIFSLLVVLIMDISKKNRFIFLSLYAAIFFIALTTILYRGIATSRTIPVLLGTESKKEYLSRHLNFSYGDFYDIDNYFVNHIKASDTVLLYGFHNFYYIDFPFIDSSWVKKDDTFTYIATQHTNLPQRFANWKMVYQNETTGVTLYNRDGIVWRY